MTNQMKLLWAAALVLLAVVFFTVNPFQDQVRRDNPEAGPLFEFDLESVDRFTMETPETYHELAKKDGAWVVASAGDYPADTSLVGRIVRALEQADRSQLVSRNPEMFESLEVTPDLGVTVTVESQGTELSRFIVGKSAQEYASSYLSPMDVNEVYLLNPMNKALFMPTRGFRDRRLSDVDPDLVRKLEWAAADTGYVLTHADTLWTVESPDGTSGEADPAVLDPVVKLAARLMASGFADPDTVSLPEDPDYVLTLHLENGQEVVTRIGGRDAAGGHYAQLPGRDVIFVLSDWSLKQLRKRAGAFLLKK